jgi:hypothetical protein
MRSTVCLLVTLAIAFEGRGSGSDYIDVNREIYFVPTQMGLATSDVCFARNGSPNANPAILAADSGGEVLLSYAGYFRNAFSSSLVSCAWDLGKSGGIGFSLSYLYVPDILVTDTWRTDGSGAPLVPPSDEWEYLTSSEMLFHAGYGREWTLGRSVLGVGVAANVMRRRLLDWTGYGVGLDAGVSVRYPRTGVRLSLVGENVTTTYVHWSSEYDENAPPRLRFAAGWRREIPYVYGAIQITYSSLDLLGNEGANASTFLRVGDSAEVPVRLTLSDPQFFFYGNYGLQYTIAGAVSLRFGIENLRRLAFGAGVALFDRRLAVDFAYITHNLAGSYTASIAYRWD